MWARLDRGVVRWRGINDVRGELTDHFGGVGRWMECHFEDFVVD